MKHQLISAGAAFDQDGDRLFSKTTSSFGSALCSCGWLSDPVEFGRQRKALHKEHVAEMSELVEFVEAGLIDVVALLEGFDEFVEAGLIDVVAPETAEEDAGEALEEIATPIDGDVSVVRVSWPGTVARLFWKALAKDGAKILADAYGLERVSNESRGLLEIKGDPEAAIWLSDRLPGLFMSANNALKIWRKTSPEYKAHDLKTSAGRKAAFAAEQNFLRAYCYAVAGTFTDDMKASPGFAEGLAYLETQEA